MFKIFIVGDSHVGKSSLIDRFCNDTFSSHYIPTKDITYKCKVISKNPKKLKLQIWDGLDQTSLQKIDCKGPFGVILMCSLKDHSSFENLVAWMATLGSIEQPGRKAMVLVSNKWDDEPEAVSQDEIQQLIKKCHLKHYQINVKEDLEVEQPFSELVTQLSNLILKESEAGNEDITEDIQKDIKHYSGDPSLATLDVRRTNGHTRNHSLANEKSVVSEISFLKDDFEPLKTEIYTQLNTLRNKDREEIESMVKKVVKESLSGAQYEQNRMHETGLPQIKPLDEVLLEYKQELLELTNNFMEFKSFITTEMERMNQRTKASLDELKEESRAISERVNSLFERIRERQNINLRLPAEMDMLNTETDNEVSPQIIVEEIYRLKQKMQGYEKRFEEEMCYMENKLKLTSATISKEVMQKMDMLLAKSNTVSPQTKSNFDAQLAEVSERQPFMRSRPRKTSLFSPRVTTIIKRSEIETRNFEEAVASYSMNQMQATRNRSNPDDFIRGAPVKEKHERASSLDTLDLSSDDINKLDDKKDQELHEDGNESIIHLHNSLTKHQRLRSAPSIDVKDDDEENNEEERLEIIMNIPSPTGEEEENGEMDGQAYQDQEDEDEHMIDQEGHEKHNEDYEDEAKPSGIKQEIAEIWNTINKVVNNTQDCLQELKTEMANTSIVREVRINHLSSDRSIPDLKHKSMNTPTIKEEAHDEQRSKNQEDIQTIITEVKDDVHNQIIHVQKELEEEVVSLRDNVFCQYNGLSEQVELGQMELKRYIEEKIEITKHEIQQALQNNLEEVLVNKIHSRDELRSANSKDGSFINYYEEEPKTTTILKEKEVEKEDKERLEKELAVLQSKVGTIEEESINSLWGTINMVAGRLDQLEKATKGKNK